MQDNDCEISDRCENVVVEGDFCVKHVGVKLCKASGIRYSYGGNSWWGGAQYNDVIAPHPVNACGYGTTKRAEFCSDRCRNLWRDTKKRRALAA
jgi:hypothetical protein